MQGSVLRTYQIDSLSFVGHFLLLFDPTPKFVFLPVVSPPPFPLHKKATQSIMHSVVGSMTFDLFHVAAI